MQITDSHIFSINPSRVLGWLLLTVFGLVTLSLIGDFSRFYLGLGPVLYDLGFIQEFNVDKENNIPTYFSSLLLLLSALLLGIISRSGSNIVLPYRAHWIGLSGIFLYISVDEMAGLHERLIIPLRTLLDTGGVLYYAWVIPASVLLVIFALVYFRFWTHLPKQPRFYIGLAGATYVLGGAGLELLGGYLADAGDSNSFSYSLVTTTEEALEMIGVVLFIYGLLLFTRRCLPSVCFEISGQPSSSPINSD